MVTMVRWGILGPGGIAHKFAADIACVDQAELVAVASREISRAQVFADQYGIPRSHGSYEALLKDANLDAVYIATLHPFHAEWSIAAMRAGKAVLCEKPACMNAGELERVLAVAKETQQFFMEAMWSACFPLMAQVRAWIGAGLIGEVQEVEADFGFRVNFNPERRLFNPDLGGGAVLDVGVYVCHFLADFLRGEVTNVKALADIGSTGVDERTSFILQTDRGMIARGSCAMRQRTLCKERQRLCLRNRGSHQLHSERCEGIANHIARTFIARSPVDGCDSGRAVNRAPSRGRSKARGAL